MHGCQKQFDFGQTKLRVVSVGYLPLQGNTSTAVLWLYMLYVGCP